MAVRQLGGEGIIIRIDGVHGDQLGLHRAAVSTLICPRSPHGRSSASRRRRALASCWQVVQWLVRGRSIVGLWTGGWTLSGTLLVSS